MNKDLEKIQTSFDVPEDNAKCIYYAITTIRDLKDKFIDNEDMVISDCLKIGESGTALLFSGNGNIH